MAGLNDVLDSLDLHAIDGGFTGTNVDASAPVVFGGQLLAQTVVAAARTHPSMQVLTMHTAFTRAARGSEPLTILVDDAHAGRSFATTNVRIVQGERQCAQSLVTLHAPDPDLITHQAEMPRVAAPDELAPRGRSDWWDVRYDPAIDLSDPDAVGPATLDAWVRFPDAPDDPVTSQALLAYATDGFLIGTAMRPHAGVGQALAHRSIDTTVLTQTITFHRPFAARYWLLLSQESPYAGRGRSVGRGTVFTTDGTMVASFSQTNMIRTAGGAAQHG